MLEEYVLGRRKYFAKEFNFTCEDCKNYKFNNEVCCEHYYELDKLEKGKAKLREKYTRKYLSESQESWNGGLLDYIDGLKERKEQELEKSKNRQIELYLMRHPVFTSGLREIENRKKWIKNEIVKCLNKRAALAVKKGYHLFIDQELRIADCSHCLHYLAKVDYCTQNQYLKNRENKRGKCSFYRLDEPEFNKRRWENEFWL